MASYFEGSEKEKFGHWAEAMELRLPVYDGDTPPKDMENFIRFKDIFLDALGRGKLSVRMDGVLVFHPSKWSGDVTDVTFGVPTAKTLRILRTAKDDDVNTDRDVLVDMTGITVDRYDAFSVADMRVLGAVLQVFLD